MGILIKKVSRLPNGHPLSPPHAHTRPHTPPQTLFSPSMGQIVSSLFSEGVETPRGSIEDDDLVSSFNALALSDDESDPNRPNLSACKVLSKDGGFVGGFDPLVLERFASAPGGSGRPSVSPGAHPVGTRSFSAYVAASLLYAYFIFRASTYSNAICTATAATP